MKFRERVLPYAFMAGGRSKSNEQERIKSLLKRSKCILRITFHVITIIYRKKFKKQWQHNNFTTTLPLALIKHNKPFESNTRNVNNLHQENEMPKCWIRMCACVKDKRRCCKDPIDWSKKTNKATQLKNIHTYKFSIHY